jgi:hypothetical protein
MDEATHAELERIADSLADSRGTRAAAVAPRLQELDAARAEFAGEFDVLQASMRNALDVRRHGPKLAAVGAGTAFIALRGPQRIAGRLLGRKKGPAPLLPKDIEKLVAGLGPDSAVVRETLEREFAGYLAARGVAKGRIGPPVGARHSFWRLFDGVTRAFAARAGWQAAGRVFGEGTQQDRS